MKRAIYLCVVCLCTLATARFATAATIDFETINGAIPFEGMLISNQFQPYYGITFRRAGGAAIPWPIIARLDSPQTAFDRDGGNADDTPVTTNATIAGQFFLTDTV